MLGDRVFMLTDTDSLQNCIFNGLLIQIFVSFLRRERMCWSPSKAGNWDPNFHLNLQLVSVSMTGIIAW